MWDSAQCVPGVTNDKQEVRVGVWVANILSNMSSDVRYCEKFSYVLLKFTLIAYAMVFWVSSLFPVCVLLFFCILVCNMGYGDNAHNAGRLESSRELCSRTLTHCVYETKKAYLNDIVLCITNVYFLANSV